MQQNTDTSKHFSEEDHSKVSTFLAKAEVITENNLVDKLAVQLPGQTVEEKAQYLIRLLEKNESLAEDDKEKLLPDQEIFRRLQLDRILKGWQDDSRLHYKNDKDENTTAFLNVGKKLSENARKTLNLSLRSRIELSYQSNFNLVMRIHDHCIVRERQNLRNDEIFQRFHRFFRLVKDDVYLSSLYFLRKMPLSEKCEGKDLHATQQQRDSLQKLLRCSEILNSTENRVVSLLNALYMPRKEITYQDVREIHINLSALLVLIENFEDTLLTVWQLLISDPSLEITEVAEQNKCLQAFLLKDYANILVLAAEVCEAFLKRLQQHASSDLPLFPSCQFYQEWDALYSYEQQAKLMQQGLEYWQKLKKLGGEEACFYSYLPETVRHQQTQKLYLEFVHVKQMPVSQIIDLIEQKKARVDAQVLKLKQQQLVDLQKLANELEIKKQAYERQAQQANEVKNRLLTEDREAKTLANQKRRLQKKKKKQQQREQNIEREQKNFETTSSAMQDFLAPELTLSRGVSYVNVIPPQKVLQQQLERLRKKYLMLDKFNADFKTFQIEIGKLQETALKQNNLLVRVLAEETWGQYLFLQLRNNIYKKKIHPKNMPLVFEQIKGYWQRACNMATQFLAQCAENEEDKRVFEELKKGIDLTLQSAEKYFDYQIYLYEKEISKLQTQQDSLQKALDNSIEIAKAIRQLHSEEYWKEKEERNEINQNHYAKRQEMQKKIEKLTQQVAQADQYRQTFSVLRQQCRQMGTPLSLPAPAAKDRSHPLPGHTPAQLMQQRGVHASKQGIPRTASPQAGSSPLNQSASFS